MKSVIKIFLGLFIISMIACNSGPKVVEAKGSSSTSKNSKVPSSTGIFDSGSGSTSPQKSNTTSQNTGSMGDFHQVKIKEVLPTEKYVYLLVEEQGQEDYWISTLKKEVNVGGVYFYKDGLLKTNFESKEYNRTFDKIYLVSNIVPANHAGQQSTSTSKTNTKPVIQDAGKIEVEGSVKIAEIVKDPKKFENKEVQLSGQVTKINPNIMGRNWIHIDDGSQEDFDMVITSNQMIPEGNIVTMTGTVRLNKDFGAGYRYDIIVEDGKVE